MPNKLPNTKRQNLRFSFLEGVLGSMMAGTSHDFFTPFLLILGGSSRHAGILNALPNFFSSIMMVKGADFVEMLGSRKKAVTIFVFLQSLTIAFIAAMAMVGGLGVWLFIAAVTLFAGLGALSQPAWASMLSELVPKKRFGRYFGWRNRIMGFIAVGSSISAGLVLKHFSAVDPVYGFIIIFCAAFVFRMSSLLFFNKIEEPPMSTGREHYFSLRDFLGQRNEFTRFVLFASAMSFSIHMAAPFFAVLMLRDLNFSYILYTSLISTGNVIIFLTTKRWGALADRIGNVRIMRFTSRAIAFVPLLWIVNTAPVFLFIIQIVAGFLYGGYLLSTTNYVYDSSTAGKRTRYIAYFNMFNGLSIFAGSMLSGLIIRYLPPIFGFNILTILLLSSMMRIITAYFIPFRLKEVRPVRRVNSKGMVLAMLSKDGLPAKTGFYE
ncbi:MAG: MFS transporter [Nitrospirae bacterium]|nr:MFS transporter [Nitrospirota bacterium]